MAVVFLSRVSSEFGTSLSLLKKKAYASLRICDQDSLNSIDYTKPDETICATRRWIEESRYTILVVGSQFGSEGKGPLFGSHHSPLSKACIASYAQSTYGDCLLHFKRYGILNPKLSYTQIEGIHALAWKSNCISTGKPFGLRLAYVSVSPFMQFMRRTAYLTRRMSLPAQIQAIYHDWIVTKFEGAEKVFAGTSWQLVSEIEENWLRKFDEFERNIESADSSTSLWQLINIFKSHPNKVDVVKDISHNILDNSGSYCVDWITAKVSCGIQAPDSIYANNNDTDVWYAEGQQQMVRIQRNSSGDPTISRFQPNGVRKSQCFMNQKLHFLSQIDNTCYITPFGEQGKRVIGFQTSDLSACELLSDGCNFWIFYSGYYYKCVEETDRFTANYCTGAHAGLNNGLESMDQKEQLLKRRELRGYFHEIDPDSGVGYVLGVDSMDLVWMKLQRGLLLDLFRTVDITLEGEWIPAAPCKDAKWHYFGVQVLNEPIYLKVPLFKHASKPYQSGSGMASQNWNGLFKLINSSSSVHFYELNKHIFCAVEVLHEGSRTRIQVWVVPVRLSEKLILSLWDYICHTEVFPVLPFTSRSSLESFNGNVGSFAAHWKHIYDSIEENLK